ncbi:MAG: EamA family transporter [Actinomycetota bacterium]|nr:EamA family transporter [Actinomycetota bacterium]
MVSIVFGLATAICFAAGSLAASRAVKLIGAYSTVAWAMLIGLTATIPLVLIAGIPTGLTGTNSIWWAVSGLGNVTGLLLGASAFRFGKVGVVAPIIATEGAIAATIAAILGESIAPLAAFVLLVIVGGVVLASIGKDPAPIPNERPGRAAILATIGAVAFGIALYATGNLSDELPIAWLLLPARSVGVVALFIPLLLLKKLKITKMAAPFLVLLGFVEILGFTCYAIGAQYGVAVTAVLASQFAPIAAIMAYLLFQEKLGRVQIVGVTTIVAGVVALILI